MDYDQLFPRLWLGSSPSRVEDVDRIVRICGANAILSLPTDEDCVRFGLDWEHIEKRCGRLQIELCRVPVKDGNSDDLRNKLLGCTSRLDGLLKRGKTVYLHCIAGLERSPSVAIAYFHWVLGYRLEEAVDFVQNCRSCFPDVRAVRLATEDILEKIEVRARAGLDASAGNEGDAGARLWEEEAKRVALREYVTGGMS
jgi:hypothetical protein